MNYKNNLSVLGFGCMRLPGDFEKSRQLILRAVEKGVDYFDTAYIYPGNEALLGKILHKENLRERVKIATKLPLFLCKSSSDFDKIFNKQLAQLKTDYIDYYLLHMLSSPDELQSLFETGLNRWLIQKKSQGQIRQIGFSFHGKQGDFVKLIDACAAGNPNAPFIWDFTMIQYNYLDVNNQAGLTGLKHAYSQNIPVIIMEPLRGGLLANPKKLPKKAVKALGDFPESRSPAEWALRWLWNHEEVSCVLSGMRNMSDLDNNISLAEACFPGCMSDRELGVIERVADVFNQLNVIPCTGCNYCMQNPDGGALCPVGVNIPGCFTAYNSKSYKQYVQNNGALISKKGLASSCIKCGKCQPRCPQSIEIAKSLKIVSRKMEPWWFKLVMAIARKFTGGDRKR